MDDELEQPGAGPDSDAAGNTAAEDNNQVAGDHELDDDQSDADSQEQTDEEDDEIEVDGKKFAMPKSAAEKLKAERMMHADYTQKTQSVAEERKAVAAEREQVQRHQQEAQQYITEVADIRAIEKQIKAIDDMNLAQYVDTDPGSVMKLQEQRRALEAERATLANSITQKQQQNALTEQQNFAKQVQEAEAYLAREIPGITPERLATIEQYAAKRGFDKQRFTKGVVSSPEMAVVFDKARMFDELQQKQAASKPKAPVQEKPVTRITATRATVKRDPEKMSTDEWAKQFYADRAKRK